MFIGLDLGTSGVKALLVDGQGTVIGSADAPLHVTHLHPGWSEQSPQDWVDACRSGLQALLATYPKEMAMLQGIGLSGQMHGATLLDAAGEILRPCILWNDTRAHAEAATLDSAENIRALSGNIVFPGFTAPKLAWVAKHEPDVFAKTATVLLPKDYISFWLTGKLATDMSDAAGTSWLDVGARAWSTPLLNASGMTRDQMPELFEGTGIVGPLRGDLARELGLPDAVSVVAGGADNAVAACGVGAMGEGDGFVSLGTSGVLLAARDGFYPDPATAVHTFCHAVPDRWYQMGVMLAATDSLNWLSRIVDRSAAQLTDELGDHVTAPTGLRFLPYLSGERTPHNDSALRGGFVGLDIAHTRADMTRAVLEGVCFGLRDSLQALRATGAKMDSLLAIGGGTGSRYWVELLATVLNMPLELPAKGEFGAALGAARLAICGVTNALPAEVMTKPEISEVISPRADLVEQCEDAYRAFVACYPNLKEMTR
jgi:xylulokinase